MVKRAKLSVIFDEEKRKDYLTGFHKRKVERRMKAKKVSEERLKQEINAVKSKYREAARKRLQNATLPPFLEEYCGKIVSQKTQIVGNRTITIKEIDNANPYFMGVSKVEDASPIVQPTPTKFEMTLKKALKMNPTKKKSNLRSQKKWKSNRKRKGRH